LMGFPDAADPEIVYVDSMAGDLFLETAADVSRYATVFDILRAVALSPEDSLQLIGQAKEETK
ncbi:MAG: Scr1 family TA system antitoxin-like transcriptional regulator, partial [Sciscionella sp.]